MIKFAKIRAIVLRWFWVKYYTAASLEPCFSYLARLPRSRPDSNKSLANFQPLGIITLIRFCSGEHFVNACCLFILIFWKFRKSLSLTFVNDRFPLAEVCEGRKVLDAILLGQSFIVDLDEVDTEMVRVIVNLLQLGQHFVACRATSRIWNIAISVKYKS